MISIKKMLFWVLLLPLIPVVLLAVLLGIFIFSVVFFNLIPYPRDSYYEQNFTKYENEFNQLLIMLDQDRKRSIISLKNDCWLVDIGIKKIHAMETYGIPADRADEYCQFYQRLHIKGGILENSFVMNGAFYGESKGLTYVKGNLDPTRVKDSLNFLEYDSSSKNYVFYKHLKGNWYIYYMGEREDL